MPKTTAVTKYDHKELAALMVRDLGIKKGHWMIQASFSFGVSNVVDEAGGASGPGALSVLTGIGIQEAAGPTPFTVDAAALGEKPATRKRRKAPTTKARA